MKFEKIKVGKKYFRTVLQPGGGGRIEPIKLVYKMLVVAKKENEVLASIIPEAGQPTPPIWYNKETAQRWKEK
jgi:hypothetical protein